MKDVKTLNAQLLKCYLQVVKVNAERLLNSPDADFIYGRFLEEYLDLLSETGKLPSNKCLVLKEPVRIPEWGKTITYIYMGSEVMCGFEEGGTDVLSELGYSAVRMVTEAVLDQMENI